MDSRVISPSADLDSARKVKLPVRLIVDPPAPGSWNMAVDEALFQVAQSTRQVTLRFYQWSMPTLSLGYFQRIEERTGHVASRDCPLVRRSTGGGAILHDRELTYSLVAPIQEDRSAGPLRLVRLVHASLIELLRGWGIAAERFGDQHAPPSPPPEQPFLCFLRRVEDDVVVGADKVGGSAQRRLHGTVLQHGSILLGRSAAAPELPGLGEIAGRGIVADQLRENWTAPLAQRLGFCCESGKLSPHEVELATQIERTQFAAESWNAKR